VAFFLPDMRGGGAERIALNIIRAFVERGLEVDLVLVKAEGELLPLLPPAVRVIDLRSRRLAAAVLPFARYLRRRRPFAVQARMWPLTVVAVLGRLLARSSARLIVSDHTVLSHQYGDDPRRMRALKWTTRLFYPLADARLLVSEGAADDLARLSGLARDTLTVVYNPVPPIPAPRVVAGVEAMWGEGGSRIISIGALKAEKNHLLLISGFARLRRRRAARLVILGEGELRPALEAHARAEGVEDDVLLPGFVSEPWPYLGSADLFVLSSDFEGFGNVLVEAMRLGLRVVTTDAPTGPAEIVAGGRFGRLVRRGDPKALADAMDAALDEVPQPERQRARADELSGEEPLRRYFDLMTGDS
jgi:glycosyltransferase involved in cell wall biosynthesis